MTDNDAAMAQQAFTPVLSALATMQSNSDSSRKKEAHDFLKSFQMSPEAWTTTFALLQLKDASAAEKLFAATTLKGKIAYDLHQLPRESLPQLRDSLLTTLTAFRSGPKPIRTQICVCLANLAIQVTEWKDVLQVVVSALGNDPESISCVFEFVRVLPEEVTDGRKINLTDEELRERTKELLGDNVQQILALLIQYSQSSKWAASNPQLLDCITSWIREIPINDIVNSSLLNVIMDALSADDSFDAAVECICAIFRETRDVYESMNVIQTLYPHVVALRPKIAKAADEEDEEIFKGISRVFAEAGESWSLLIARMPEQFRGLVEAILEFSARDKELDAISLSFNFWYELKQYLTLEIYMQARLLYVDIYSKLVDVMIGHLEYPKPDGVDGKDLFEGDRTQEEKFREFRHLMGDVLKACCEVIGVTDCLKKSYQLIENWVATYGSQISADQIPEWQKLEAPLFSMRAMGKMVPSDENVMLPRLIPLIVRIPDHEKVRFQAIMALGRYTEWTAKHPETLQPQLDYIMAAFHHPSIEVVRAAALSFKFFCNDCADLLKGFVVQLQQFYQSVLDKLASHSQDEITDGVASVIAKLPSEQIYSNLKLYCDPIMKSLMTMAQHATDKQTKLALADKLQLITLFIQRVQPQVKSNEENPAIAYCKEIFPVLAAIAGNFVTCVPILERVCRCWRYMVLSYRTDIAPLLPDLADQLVNGFTISHQGCFLWATDSIIREFSDGAEHVDEQTTVMTFGFFERQASNFLSVLNELPPDDLPDLIEDFFRLSDDVLLYHSSRALTSRLMTPILSAATTSLSLLKEEPLIATLHFLRDFLAYGDEMAPFSFFDNNSDSGINSYPNEMRSVQQQRSNSPATRETVKILLGGKGAEIVRSVLTGMMYSFPRNCFPDGSGVLLAMMELLPQETAGWVRRTIEMLPEGSVGPKEAEELLLGIDERILSGEFQRIRMLLQDFSNSYRRRNVAPREGLGRLEARMIPS